MILLIFTIVIAASMFSQGLYSEMRHKGTVGMGILAAATTVIVTFLLLLLAVSFPEALAPGELLSLVVSFGYSVALAGSWSFFAGLLTRALPQKGPDRSIARTGTIIFLMGLISSIPVWAYSRVSSEQNEIPTMTAIRYVLLISGAGVLLIPIMRHKSRVAGGGQSRTP